MGRLACIGFHGRRSEAEDFSKWSSERRPLVGDFPYVFLEWLVVEAELSSEVENISVLVSGGSRRAGVAIRRFSESVKRARTRPAEQTCCVAEAAPLEGCRCFVSDGAWG